MDIINQFLFEATDKSDKKKSTKCIIKYADKYLILRRAVNQPGEGSWDLAGGEIEEGESPKDALIREVNEETALGIKNIKSKKIANVKTDCGEWSVNIFTADAENDNVYLRPSENNREKFAWWNKPQPEHSEYKWVKYADEVEELNMLDEKKEN